MVYATLSELIEYGKNLEFSHRAFNSNLKIHDTKTNDTIIIPYAPLINKYREYFDPYIIRLELTEDEQRAYWHSPKILSYDLYGTTEYWSILLYINEAPSFLDFEPEYLNVISKSDIQEVVNELMIIDEY